MLGIGSGWPPQRALLFAAAACLLLAAGCGTESTTTVTEKVVVEKSTTETGVTSPTGCVNVSTGNPASCESTGSVTVNVYNEANDLPLVDSPEVEQIEEEARRERIQEQREELQAAIRRQRLREERREAAAKAEEEATSTTTVEPPPESNCAEGYDPCVPPYPPDVDCPDVGGPISVSGSDPHGLDADGDGVGCE